MDEEHKNSDISDAESDDPGNWVDVDDIEATMVSKWWRNNGTFQNAEPASMLLKLSLKQGYSSDHRWPRLCVVF